MTSIRRTYDVHGRRLTVEAPTRPWGTLLDGVFSAYRVDTSPGEAPVLRFVAPEDLDVPEPRETVGEAEDGTRFERTADDRVVVTAEAVGRAVIAADGLTAHIAPTAPDPGWAVGHRLIEPVVVECLRARGLFGIHAAAVARGDHGLLLCGRSGSGKSTAALALARSGWGFLGDDTCYLEAAPAAPTHVRARWSDLHLTSTSMEVLLRPEERAAVHRPEGSEKYFLPVHEAPGIRPQADCHVAAVVFPEIVDRDEAGLTRLEARDALPRLLAQSLVPGRRDAERAHFDRLVGLCAAVPSYVLAAGRDLGAVLAVLDRIFAHRP